MEAPRATLPTAMTLPRSLKVIGGVFLTLIVLTILVVAFFDWNSLRDPIARKVSSSTGRTFAINGDLNVHLSLRPRIVANDIVIGNAAWGREPTMATLKRLDFRIDLLKLLAGRVEFPAIALSEPHFAFEVSPDGTPNWTFTERSKNKPFEFPTVDVLTIDHGSATYRDPTTKTDLALDVKTLAAEKDNPEDSLEVTGKGRIKGLPASFYARGGALLSLRSADRPYPIKANAMLGTTKASVAGTLLDPLRLKGEKLNFTIEGSDLALLFPIIGVPIPPTPPYKLAGFLNHTDDMWVFDHFKGIVGRSDLAGEFAVDRGKRPQMITANLVSQKLDMKDFGGFIGADRGTKSSQIPPPKDRVLPAEPFSLEKLLAADANVHFRGENILTEKMPLEKMSAHLIVSNGKLKLAPLDFRVAGGNLVSQIEMDGRKPGILTHADITAKGLQLDRMFPASKLAGASTGTIGGRAKLDAKGNSIAQMLASANGEAALIMDGGSVSELMLRLSNLDIANSIGVLLGGDTQVPIHCMVGNFKAVDGDFKVEALVLDTPKVNITGSGHVNFADESLHLRLVSQSKGFSLASLRGPIAVNGTFKTPLVRPEAGGALARGGLAVALGVATAGIGALIPLLDFGKDKNSNCTALMSQAKSDAGVKASDMTPRPAK
ncbi:MAG: AsmA family protein [Rhodocyclaceae bacterium]|nr:AsmA family protein [Rhodocyclaceae bacterium]